MAASILTPAQVLQSPQEHLGQTISVRGYLIVWPGYAVSEEPLVMEFDSMLVETDRTFQDMSWAVEKSDYFPAAFLAIQNPRFGEIIGRALGGYGDMGSRFLLKMPVVVSARLEKNASPDIMADYVLTDPNLLVVEFDEFHGIPEQSIFLTETA